MRFFAPGVVPRGPSSRRGRIPRAIAGLALLGLAGGIGSAPAAGAAQIATLGEPVTRTLATGITATWYPHTAIDDYPVPPQLVTVTWPLGDPHYRLHTVTTAGPISADGFLTRRRISSWGATQPSSLIAAISPDFATYHSRRAIPSGLEIAHHVILHAPAGSVVPPSVGYTSGGRLVFGNVRVQPVTFQLPNGVGATVGVVNHAPTSLVRVGAYTTIGARIRIPTGDRAIILNRSPFASAEWAPTGVTTFASQPKAYAVHDAAQATRYLVSPIRRPRAGATHVTVPTGGAVLILRKGGGAAAGFNQLLAQPTPQVQANATDRAWAAVTDVMGGKPLLIRNGTAIASKPVIMTNYQWSAPVSRIALGETADGKGIIAILNAANHSNAGINTRHFAQTLVQLGVTNAIAFDAGPVPTIYSPRYRNGTCSPNPGWCYQSTAIEWRPALVTALYHTP